MLTPNLINKRQTECVLTKFDCLLEEFLHLLFGLSAASFVCDFCNFFFNVHSEININMCQHVPPISFFSSDELLGVPAKGVHKSDKKSLNPAFKDRL